MKTRTWQNEDHCSRGNRPNVGGGYLLLECFLGFEPKMLMFKVNKKLKAITFFRLTLEEYSYVSLSLQ